MGLAQLIKTHEQEVLARWKEMVRTLSDARHLSEESLENHVPDLLDWLAVRLRERDTADVYGSQMLSRVHAFQRVGDDFDLVEVLAELAVLRDVVLGLWVEQPGDVSPAEVLQLNRDLDDVVAVCTTEFARQVMIRHGASKEATEAVSP
ncbi:RsbRD N-terminal domain-containing protein [Archangium sp.]|uniref:RsbRD N-terminal domain-containing protein n=1 Tax=Archangium sp. TaxID=1872627 RepID=UPI002D406BAD|nr:RsbRD N-terminal domain-containing protein [Archangium sp.]HYO55746.1 RsbRD N-terminal domain-containing protein [Archangium sp.]